MELNRDDISLLADLVAERVEATVKEGMYPGRWLTLREAMDYAKVRSVNTIKRWIDQGYIYGHKRSGHWIVDRQSIDDWFLSENVS
jgi:hypothetical protein